MDNIEQTLSEIKDLMQKAAVTNASYAATPASRSIFAPENLDPVVKLMVPTATPIRSMMPRSKGFGQAAAWKKLTSQLAPGNKGTGVIVGSGATGTGYKAGFADAGSPNTSTTFTISVATAAYKNLGADVEVGRQAIASSRGYQDIRDEMVRYKTLEVMLGEENMILNGDSTIHSTEFDGLAKSITTNSGTLAVLTASGIDPQKTTPYWAYGAQYQKLVSNPVHAKKLADDLQGSGSIQRIIADQQGAATGGMHLSKMVNPVDGSLMDVIASRYCGNWSYLLTVTEPSGEAALEMEDLEPLSVYEPPTSTHSVISRVYDTTVLKVIYEVHQLKLGGANLS